MSNEYKFIGKWNDDFESPELKDHFWYLIVHEDFETPMKAKYTSDALPFFTFFSEKGKETAYIIDGKVKYWMPSPNMPDKK